MHSTNTKAAHIIADAFLHYALMKYAFNGHTQQQRSLLLHKLFSKSVAAANLYGGVIVTPHDLGAVIWLNGKNFPLTLTREVRSGMATLPFQLGLKPTLRLMRHEGGVETWVKQNAAPAMGYLWCIGVLAQARGKGYSRMLINQCIAQMHQQGLTECWLTTEDPTNVTIYQKMGFAVMRKQVVKSSGFTTWSMKRDIF